MLLQGVSVIVCCYNSSARMLQTLEHLSQQILDGVKCEVLLIDNASTDSTADIATNIWSAFKNQEIDFRIIYEPKPGLVYARERGLTEARFEYSVFCDDDNWLDKTYINNVYNLFSTNHNVGVIGGHGTACFAVDAAIPFWFNKFESSYAVGKQSGNEGLVSSVYGAGMAVRTHVLKKSIAALPFLLNGRKGKKLSAGDDGEILYRFKLAGYKIWYSPALTFQHFLPHSRLQWPYLKAMHIGFAHTNVVINLYEHTVCHNDNKLPTFYWLKKAFYYTVIYFKYWPKQYRAYSNTEGTVEEINHVTWGAIALSYLYYNVDTAKIYQQIISLKQNLANTDALTNAKHPLIN